MAEKSIYSRGGNGMTTGGLDGYLGPEAQDFSNLPEHTDNPLQSPATIDVDCSKDSSDAVCQIAAAEKQRVSGVADIK